MNVARIASQADIVETLKNLIVIVLETQHKPQFESINKWYAVKLTTSRFDPTLWKWFKKLLVGVLDQVRRGRWMLPSR
mgnify:CR=1 FL=1